MIQSLTNMSRVERPQKKVDHFILFRSNLLNLSNLPVRLVNLQNSYCIYRRKTLHLIINRSMPLNSDNYDKSYLFFKDLL